MGIMQPRRLLRPWSRIIRRLPVRVMLGFLDTTIPSARVLFGEPDTGLGRHMPELFGSVLATFAAAITAVIGAGGSVPGRIGPTEEL